MFEIEFLRILNSYFQVDEYEQKKLFNSLKNLIKDNPEDFLNFTKNQELSTQQTTLLKSLEESLNEQKSLEENKDEKQKDLEIIKKTFLSWNQYYQQHNKIPQEEEEKLIEELIRYYMPNRFFVLEETLKIQDTQDFEDFKNMLQNYIRNYFAQSIENYLNSSDYEELHFFAKRKRNKEILLLMKKIGKYNFDEKKIKEVLQ